MVATLAVAVAGMTLAAAKAATVPISADEAWSWADWIARGFPYIWTHYSAANNHVLETLLARASLHLFGDTLFALRLPALAGFGILLAAGAALSRIVIDRRLLRLLFVASIAFHPYLIDFAACARGYTLGLGFGFVGLLALAHALTTRPTTRLLAAASLAFGLAIGSVPIFASFVASALVAYLWLAPVRSPDVRGTVIALAVPMAVVLVAIYGGVIGQLGASRLRYGADDGWTSLASLHALLVYTPQGVVDARANPALDQAVVPWQRGPLPAAFHAVFDGSLFAWVIGGGAVASIAVAARHTSSNLGRVRALPAFTLGLLLLAVIVLSVVLRLPWPLHRTWIPAVPLLFLSILVCADTVSRHWSGAVARAATALVAVAWLAFVLNGAARIRLTKFREWPDSAVVPDALDTIAHLRPPPLSAVTVGHPWYLHTCLRYSRAHGGRDWLRIPDQSNAERPLWDFMLVNRRMGEPPGYVPVKRYPELGLVLMHRADLETSGAPVR